MSLMSIDVQCGICEVVSDTLVQRPAADYGLPCYACPECGGEAYRVLSVPNNLRASHPDGYSRGSGWQAAKAALKLKAERGNLPDNPQARADINREIWKAEKAASSGYVKSAKGEGSGKK